MPADNSDTAVDQNDRVDNDPEATKQDASKLQLLLESIGRNITLTTKEWLHSLLYQPTDPPFRFNADFKNELGRVVRLIVAVTTISGIVVGGMNIVTGTVDVVQTVKDVITVFIVAILVSIIFLPAFYVCGVRITPPIESGNQEKKPLNFGQVFFTVLYTFVPWLPVLVFILSSVTAAEGMFMIDFLIIAPILCFIYMFVNFSKSMKVITNSSYPRIWGSLSIPLVLVLVYLMA